jgi:hypothetical protein
VIDSACLRSILLLAVLLGMLYRPVQILTYSNIKVKIWLDPVSTAWIRAVWKKVA